MKLCETVFAFHHKPSAMTGTDGAKSSNAACTTANPTSSASRGECRKMLLPVAMGTRRSQRMRRLTIDSDAVIDRFMVNWPGPLHLFPALGASLAATTPWSRKSRPSVFRVE
jgi:hypothetical protein